MGNAAGIIIQYPRIFLRILWHFRSLRIQEKTLGYSWREELGISVCARSIAPIYPALVTAQCISLEFTHWSVTNQSHFQIFLQNRSRQGWLHPYWCPPCPLGAPQYCILKQFFHPKRLVSVLHWWMGESFISPTSKWKRLEWPHLFEF